MGNVFRSVLAGAKAILQSKSATVTPSASWSSAYTGYSSITPDTGYTGMSDVQVRTPMIRDNTLVTASSVTTPSTVYNGDTSQSNSDRCLRLAPTKDGMAYTGSYLYLKPNSYLGNASASDVLSGKTFSSSNGIQITGTGSGGVTPSGNKALSYTTNGTETGIDVTNYATVSVTRNIPQGVTPTGDKAVTYTTNGTSTVDVTNYATVTITRNISASFTETTLWTNSSPTSTFAEQNVTLSQSMDNFTYLRFYYAASTTNQSTSNTASSIVSVTDMKKSTETQWAPIFALSSKTSSSGGNRVRRIFYVSNTQLTITNANQISGSTNTNTAIIPTKITGMK